MTALLIDTDPGVDDALALLLAFATPGVEVVALTIAAGNVGLMHTVANALKLCEVAGVSVPIYPGCATPLVRAAEDAAYVHGRDGFGDTGYTPTSRAAATEHAALAMLRLSGERPGELTFVMLGPLTNLALALRLDPTLPQRVKHLVIMGGAVTGVGNTSVAAEFNIAFDPEAAHIVFGQWPSFDLVDWEAVLAHPLRHSEVERWLRADTAQARFYDAISKQTRQWSRPHHGENWHSADPLAIAVAVAPEGILDVQSRPVAIELDGGLTRGATIVDWQRRSGQPDNANIVRRYDQAKFEAMLEAALAGRT